MDPKGIEALTFFDHWDRQISEAQSLKSIGPNHARFLTEECVPFFESQ